MPRKRSKTSSKTVKEADNVLRALALRRDGATLPEIAKAVGCALSTAHARVKKGLDLAREDMRAEAGALMELELLRLDKLWRSAQKLVAAGDPSAIQAALRVSAQRAKLLGLEAPTRHVIEDPEKALKDLLGPP